MCAACQQQVGVALDEHCPCRAGVDHGITLSVEGECGSAELLEGVRHQCLHAVCGRGAPPARKPEPVRFSWATLRALLTCDGPRAGITSRNTTVTRSAIRTCRRTCHRPSSSTWGTTSSSASAGRFPRLCASTSCRLSLRPPAARASPSIEPPERGTDEGCVAAEVKRRC